jgi:23S rRNA (uracil1939-C5)-methyltransferase
MIRTTIVGMAHGGFGVARIDGMVHFVPDVLPGEVVEIEAVTRKRHYVFARLDRIVETSGHRTVPFCRYVGNCGGCQLQHIHYPEQLRIKEEIFLDQMERIGKLRDLPAPEMIGSQAKRIRMRFQVRQGEIGLFQRRSHRICAIHACAVAADGVNQGLVRLREALSGLAGREALKGTITVLAPPDEVHVAADLSLRPARQLGDRFRDTIGGYSVLDRGRWHTSGHRYLILPVRGIGLHVSADLFVQANPEINESMVRSAVAFMGGTARVADLYAGCGNVTLPLAKSCGEVVGIEKNPRAVEAARRTAELEGIANVSFRCADAADSNLKGIRGVVVDPPRSGLAAGVLRRILWAAPRRIAYISCNPSTLARDLRSLTAGGYRIHAMGLFDMFPQTHHIESLTLLVRQES